MEANEVTINNTSEISGIIEERGLDLEDIKAAIAACETTGKKLVRSDDEGRFLCKAIVGKLNVYAEYSRDGEGFTLHTAYAHRVMLVSED